MHKSTLLDSDRIELVISLFDRLTVPIAAASATMLVVGVVVTMHTCDTVAGFIAATTLLSSAARLVNIRLFHRSVLVNVLDLKGALEWQASFLRFTRIHAALIGLFVLRCFQMKDPSVMLLGSVLGLGYMASVIALGRIPPRETALTACFTFIPFAIACLLQRDLIYFCIIVVSLIYLAAGYITGSNNYRMMCNQLRTKSVFAEVARHDPLTGLLNRSALRNDLNRIVCNGNAAIHSIDLDHFKAVNDTYGHAAGDAVLRTVAARLNEIVSENDLVVRLGGDEFVVVQWSVKDRGEAERLADRIVLSLRAPYDFPGCSITIGASVGVTLSADSAAIETLLASADEALYVAKRCRNSFAFADPGARDGLRIASVA